MSKTGYKMGQKSKRKTEKRKYYISLKSNFILGIIKQYTSPSTEETGHKKFTGRSTEGNTS